MPSVLFDTIIRNSVSLHLVNATSNWMCQLESRQSKTNKLSRWYNIVVTCLCSHVKLLKSATTGCQANYLKSKCDRYVQKRVVKPCSQR